MHPWFHYQKYTITTNKNALFWTLYFLLLLYLYFACTASYLTDPSTL